MKATFNYSGDLLTISLSIEGEGDQAIAKIVEKRLCDASIYVTYENSARMYDYRDPKPNGIYIKLQPKSQTDGDKQS